MKKITIQRIQKSAAALLLIFATTTALQAQTPNGFVGVGTTNPKAKLHIENDSSGLLIPKYATLALANSNSLPKLKPADHKGLMIYIDEISNQGFWFYDGTAYVKVASSGNPFFKVSVANNNNIVYNDASNYGKNFIVNADSVNYKGSGSESKMMFVPTKNAFRVGAIDNKNWDLDNIGSFSFASGSNTKAIGDYSTAMGANTTASGYNSTAIGSNTTASGENTTAMGEGTSAIGDYSTAFGERTNASGDNSTAMGVNTTASGRFSTAIGANSIASGNYSTTMGIGTNASGIASTALGQYTTAKSNGEIVVGISNTDYIPLSTTGYNAADRAFVVGTGSATNSKNDGLIVFKDGTIELDSLGINPGSSNNRMYALKDSLYFQNTNLMRQSTGVSPFFKVSPTNNNNIVYNDASNYGKNFLVNVDSVNYKGSGLESKMMFIGSKYAFRIGGTSTNNWNLDSIGTYSFATGTNTKAKHFNAVAMGSATTASGATSTALGASTIASGVVSTAMGSNTMASGNFSTAMGGFTTAIGQYSTAMGQITTASGVASTAMGQSTTASGSNSTAMGNSTSASGEFSTAMGRSTTASGNYSTAMGSETIASGDYSIAFGETTTASGVTSTAFGKSTTASGGNSIAIGTRVKAKSVSEIAVGSRNTDYTPGSVNSFISTDRAFGVGIGNISDADGLIVYKNGTTFIGNNTNSGSAPVTTSTLTVAGAIADSIITTTGTTFTFANETATVLDNNATTSAITYTLPNPALCKGRKIAIKKINAANHAINITCTGIDAGGNADGIITQRRTVENVTTGNYVATAATTSRKSFILQSDGANWWVIATF